VSEQLSNYPINIGEHRDQVFLGRSNEKLQIGKNFTHILTRARVRTALYNLKQIFKVLFTTAITNFTWMNDARILQRRSLRNVSHVRNVNQRDSSQLCYVSILIADFPASPETEQLLSVARAHGNTTDAHARLQPEERRPSDKTHVQGDVSSSRTTSRDKLAGLNGNVSQVGETSDGTGVAAIRLPSIVANGGDRNNDDPPPYNAIPPPYSVIAPLNHVSWPYEIFSFGHSYSTDRAEMPLALFQVASPAPMDFHAEGGNEQPSFSTPYQFFKFGCRRSSVVPSRETSSLSDNGIAEKINDIKSRSK